MCQFLIKVMYKLKADGFKVNMFTNGICKVSIPHRQCTTEHGQKEHLLVLVSIPHRQCITEYTEKANERENVSIPLRQCTTTAFISCFLYHTPHFP